MPNEIGDAYLGGRNATRGAVNPFVPALDERTQFLARMWWAGYGSTHYPPDKLPDRTADVDIAFGDTTDDDGVGRYLLERRRRGLPSP
ncbi:hypothetical protein [Smaragdicoccus niigatensis]|uniref:hypothetical protein n=1 Tax=Smaragdicoccus niigatensis TaxID=359359 RepID=UPI000363EA45|nr:hypothetical protein [Smaragdicoccus niigatensis]